MVDLKKSIFKMQKNMRVNNLITKIEEEKENNLFSDNNLFTEAHLKKDIKFNIDGCKMAFKRPVTSGLITHIGR